jgi:hypothetical protein
LRTKKTIELDSTGIHVSQLGFMMSKTEIDGHRIEHLNPYISDAKIQFANSLISFEFVGFYAKNKYHIIPYHIKNVPNYEYFSHHFYLIKASGFYTLNTNGNLEFVIDFYLLLTKDGTNAEKSKWKSICGESFPSLDYDKFFKQLQAQDTVEFVLTRRKVTEQEFNLTKQTYHFRVEGNKVIVNDISEMKFYSGTSQKLLPEEKQVQLTEYGNILDTIVFNSPYQKTNPPFPPVPFLPPPVDLP